MAEKDYYEILEVKKTDSQETIKKNYKKLALKFHPDRVGEDKKKEYENNFKKINEAYSVLSDETKRRKYDAGEVGNFSQESQFSGADLSDIFRDLLRSGHFGTNFQNDDDEEHTQNYELTIDFTEAAFGCEKDIKIKKTASCENCDGSGSEDQEFEKCRKCDGHGVLKFTRNTPWGAMVQRAKCPTCYGKGQIPLHACTHCQGKGIVTSDVAIKVKIPQGIDDGQTLRVRTESSDLFLTIAVRPHKVFKRDEFDIFMDFDISFSQAALGGKISIPTLSSEEIKVKIAKGTESGSVLRLAGKGIPFIDRPHHRGDQYIKLIVKTPKKLTAAQTKLFEELAKLD